MGEDLLRQFARPGAFFPHAAFVCKATLRTLCAKDRKRSARAAKFFSGGRRGGWGWKELPGGPLVEASGFPVAGGKKREIGVPVPWPGKGAPTDRFPSRTLRRFRGAIGSTVLQFGQSVSGGIPDPQKRGTGGALICGLARMKGPGPPGNSSPDSVTFNHPNRCW